MIVPTIELCFMVLSYRIELYCQWVVNELKVLQESSFSSMDMVQCK